MASELREKINAGLKDAMKAQSKRRLSTFRLITAAFKERDIQNRGAGKGEASDQECREVLAKMIKQRRESADAFEQGGRPELAQAEREEIAVIEEFLPRQLSDGDMRAAVNAVMAEEGVQSIKDMGRAIALLKERYAGQMDMAKASGIIKELLR